MVVYVLQLRAQESLTKHRTRCASGGIGRLAGFRCQCSLRACGFDSRLAHQTSGRKSGGFFFGFAGLSGKFTAFALGKFCFRGLIFCQKPGLTLILTLIGLESDPYGQKTAFRNAAKKVLRARIRPGQPDVLSGHTRPLRSERHHLHAFTPSHHPSAIPDDARGPDERARLVPCCFMASSPLNCPVPAPSGPAGPRQGARERTPPPVG